MKVTGVLGIGIPTRNQAAYLERTLNSLLQQSVRCVHIVVSNNRSTDDTPIVLSRFREFVEVIEPPRLLSMAGNWNFVVRAIKADWVALLSSDDVANSNYVGSLLKGIQQAEDAVLVRAAFERIDGTGAVLGTSRLLSVRTITRPPRTFYEQLLGPKCGFCAFAVRKSAWSAVGGFPEDLHYFADWGMWLKLSPLGAFVYVDEVISQYREGYRPHVARERLFGELADDVTLFTTLIPEVAARLPAVAWGRILRASRTRFCRRLAHASRVLLPSEKEERQVAADLLRPWALHIKGTGLLERFREGAVFPTGGALDGIKRMARALYARVQS